MSALLFTAANLNGTPWKIYCYLDGNDSYVHAQAAQQSLTQACAASAEVSCVCDLHCKDQVERIVVLGTHTARFRHSNAHPELVMQTGCTEAFSGGVQGNTMLIISGHGTGCIAPDYDQITGTWVYPQDMGICPCKDFGLAQDERMRDQVARIFSHKSFRDAHRMTSFLGSAAVQQLGAHCVNLLGRPIDIVGYDACHMGVFDCMYDLKDVARFCITSQECEAKDGWSYHDLVSACTAPRAEAVARKIVAQYDAWNRHRGADRYSLAVSDLGAIDSCAAALDKVIAAMRTMPQDQLLELLCSAYAQRPRITAMPWYLDGMTWVDSLHQELDDVYNSEQVQQLRGALDALRVAFICVTVASCVGPASKRLTGCSWYLPQAVIHHSYTTSYKAHHRWYELMTFFTSGAWPQGTPQ